MTIALSTDYDCWHEEEEDVGVEAVVAMMKKNVETAKAILRESIPKIAKHRNCLCSNALKNAIIIAPDRITLEAKKRLSPIIGKYIK